MMYVAILPDGSRIPLEPWVVREWQVYRSKEALDPASVGLFFDPVLAEDLRIAVKIRPRWSYC